jgi:hypothetical protein
VSGASLASVRPSTGARFSVERAEQDETRVVYRGFVHLPDADLPLSVEIELPSGTTRACLQAEGHPDLEKAAAALVRSATRTAVAAHAALPRKIVRWRG